MTYRVLDYNTDVNEALNKRKSASNMLRFGAEIETGWHVEDAREAFFKTLEAKGLHQKSIAKFDRSIGADLCAEIVTLPMRYDELASSMREVGDALQKNVKDSSMNMCGVHIHATREPMNQSQFWRVVSAIMVDKKSWQSWVRVGDAQRAFDIPAFERNVAGIHDFWDKVTLRHANRYCGRYGYNNVTNADGRGNHEFAVIRGKHTPTVEFRLFKSARSPVVLASYPEVVAALIEFANEPDESLLQVVDKDLIAKQADYKAAREEFVQLVIDDNDGLTIRYYEDNIGANRGSTAKHVANGQGAEVYRTVANGLTQYIINGYMYDDFFAGTAYATNPGQQPDYFVYNSITRFPLSKALYAKLYRLRERLVAPQKTELIGAVPWKDHTFPVKEFIGFLDKNSDKYPHIAERMLLPKFRFIVGGAGAVKEPDADIVVYDTKTPHDAVKFGCLVEDQREPNVLFRVSSFETNRAKVVTAEDVTYTCKQLLAQPGADSREPVYDHEARIPGEHVLHICEGAKRREGHDE